MYYVPSSTDAKRLSELLDKACSLIVTLEGYLIDADSDYDKYPIVTGKQIGRAHV